MDQEFVWAFVGVGALCATGFVAGLAKPLSRSAPFVASSIVIAGYLILVAVTGAWVAACPGCAAYMSSDSARPLDLLLAAFYGGLFTAGIIVAIVLGVSVSTLVRKVRTG